MWLIESNGDSAVQLTKRLPSRAFGPAFRDAVQKTLGEGASSRLSDTYNERLGANVDPMTHHGFMEELMERIHGQVRTDAQGTTPATGASVLRREKISVTDQILFRLRQHQPNTRNSPWRIRVEFTDLRAELENCLTSLERFGDVNPRPPGYLNDRMQSVKRLMRRTLVWYMRPLRLFHKAVIRTLQQLLDALEKQQEMLGECASQTDVLTSERRLDDLELGTYQIYELSHSAIETSAVQFRSMGDELKALRKDLNELRAEVFSSRPQVREVLSPSRQAEHSSSKNKEGV